MPGILDKLQKLQKHKIIGNIKLLTFHEEAYREKLSMEFQGIPISPPLELQNISKKYEFIYFVTEMCFSDFLLNGKR